MSQAPSADFSMQRSSREATNIPKVLAEWLATELPDAAEPSVTLHTGIAANGMSSETLVLDASWTEDGERREGEFVARVAPAAEDVPVFPTYRLAGPVRRHAAGGQVQRRTRADGPVDGADR